MAGPVGGLLKLGTMHTKQPKLNTKTHTANRNLLANVETLTTNTRQPNAAPIRAELSHLSPCSE